MVRLTQVGAEAIRLPSWSEVQSDGGSSGFFATLARLLMAIQLLRQLLTPGYDSTLLNMPGYRHAVQDLIHRLVLRPDDAAVAIGCRSSPLTYFRAEQVRRTLGLDRSPIVGCHSS